MEKNEEIYHYEEGIKEFVSYVNEGKEVLHDVTTFAGAFQWNKVGIAFNIMISTLRAY